MGLVRNAQTWHTLPLIVVAVVQLLFCSVRVFQGDVLGAASDGIAAVFGLAAVNGFTVFLSFLYGIACAIEILCYSSGSLHVLHMNYGIKLPEQAVLAAEFLRHMLPLTPLFAALGAVLAMRLYWHAASEGFAGSAEETDPLLSKPQNYWSATNSPSGDTEAPWPHPTPPSPRVLSWPAPGNEPHKGGSTYNSAPFQGIFRAQVPLSPKWVPIQLRPRLLDGCLAAL
mmetsp:Transcript_1280/g.3123  ORF Transcript_1280/g.3123 Transcript_1280/m.3123 type:complete len:227 (+) Transcript_1280:49-729(+)